MTPTTHPLSLVFSLSLTLSLFLSFSRSLSYITHAQTYMTSGTRTHSHYACTHTKAWTQVCILFKNKHARICTHTHTPHKNTNACTCTHTRIHTHKIHMHTHKNRHARTCTHTRIHKNVHTHVPLNPPKWFNNLAFSQTAMVAPVFTLARPG
jgi:hypothetical protein